MTAQEMKNKLTDLNNHLFAELERLSEDGMTYTEAAKMLGVPYSTIYNHYSA